MNTQRMVDTFMELVRIDSVSRNEGQFHEHLKKVFTDLGLHVYEDNTMEQTGLGGNNLIFTLPGTEGTGLFFSAHTDTVEPGVNIEPIISEGLIVSKGDTILGADGKAGIAILIEVIRHLKENNIHHPTLEFVFTPGEEIGLVGAAALDTSQLKAKYGLVLDSNGPIGGLTLGSPTLMTIESTIHGKSAHAGLEPEKGVSAIEILSKIISSLELGRINEYTTANVGVISGGVATNIVADTAYMKMEIRSVKHDELELMKQSIIDRIDSIVNEYGVSHDTKMQTLSQGYIFDEEMQFIQLIKSAIQSLALPVRTMITGGGSDANVFNMSKQAVNISIGYENIHTTSEYIVIEEMEKAVSLILEIIQLAGAPNDLE